MNRLSRFGSTALLVLTCASVARAQSVPARSVDGRVRHPVRSGGDSTGMAGVPGAMVTLHRVGKDKAGPIDSVHADRAGAYHFRYTPSGASDAVYFASVSWGGIAYFTAPLRNEQVTGDDADITVFDTTSIVYPLVVKGRHLVVGKVDSAQLRTIVEVFELSNDSLTTLTSPERANPTPTWSVDIPRAAQDVRLTQGEISAEAFVYKDGRVSVFAPIAPGLKQIAFSYKLPAANFPIAVTAVGGAVVFEVLLEEEQGNVFGTGFTAVAPVTIENRHFRRFLAQDLKPSSPFTVELPAGASAGRGMYFAGLLIAIGFVALLLIARVVQRRAARASVASSALDASRAVSAPRATAVPLHEQLAHEIAALDATFARQSTPSDSLRATYEERRRELKDALNDALASLKTAQ